MIFTKTPYRISFFGGGTDYPQWYLKEGGAVISTTIDKYCYISCRALPPFFNIKHRIVWSHIETVSTIAEILHPAVREGLKYLGFDDTSGFEIHHQGDLPARSGMGTSSSFAVGLIKALTALQGKMISAHDLALKAIDLEQNILKENVGSQDQVAAAHGGFNIVHFYANGEIKIEPLTISPSRVQDLESQLMLFYTGASRFGSEINSELLENISTRQNELREMRSLVDKAFTVLCNHTNLDEFGKLLHKTWLLKRSINSHISNFTIDKIYKSAFKNGALGGKLLGAGSSGFMVFYVPYKKQKCVREALAHYLHVPFRFENEGSSIIFYKPPADRYFAQDQEEAPVKKAASK